jgi:signal transduction histidine kinase/PAS domain-containing protein
MSALGIAILLLTFVSGLAALGIVHIARGRSDVPGARAFTLQTLAQSVWCLTYGFQLLASSEVSMWLFDAIQTVFTVASAFLWLVFVLEYTGATGWLTRRRIALLSIEPAIYSLLYVTNPMHHLLLTDVGTAQSVGVTYLDKTLTAIPLFQILLIYIVTLVPLVLLARFILRSQNLYRKQAAAIFVGSVVVVIMITLWVVTLGTSWGLDLTPVFMVVRSAFIALALFKYDFLEVVPLAPNAVLEEMNDPVLILDDEQVLADYNREARSVLDLDQSQVGESVSGVLTDVMAAVESNQPLRIEDDSIKTSGGHQAVYQPSRTELTDQHGIVRGELVVLQDITTQKRRETKLESLQAGSQQLIETTTVEDVAGITTRKAATVLGHPFVGVFLHDEKTGELHSASLSGPIVSELGADSCRLADDLAWGVYSGDTMETYDGSAFGGGPLAELPLEQVLLYPLGAHGLLCIGTKHQSGFSDDERRFVEILGLTAQSALSRAKRETELERHRTQLQERNERLDQFASVVSHDLRNPLTVAQGNLQLAMETGAQDPMEDAAASLDRMETIIDDVLTLARQGESIGETTPVALHTAVEDAWSNVATDTATLVVETDATIEADRDRLLQLFENCFRNAHEHVGTDVTVTVGCDETRLYVEDDGPGIPEANRDDVLESGYTTNEDGTGFGLAIVSQIANAHDWELTVTDGSAGGARFEFEGIARPTRNGE